MRCFGQTQPTPEAMVVALTSGVPRDGSPHHLASGSPCLLVWASTGPWHLNHLPLSREACSQTAVLGGSLRQGVLSAFLQHHRVVIVGGEAPGPSPTQPSYLLMLVLAKV